MRMTVYEGTAEEIARIVRAIQPGAANIVSAGLSEEPSTSMMDDSIDAPADSEGSRKCVTAEFARRMLTRCPLSDKQKIVLKTLKEAHPEWVSRDELCAENGWTPHQLAGLMGTFGKRTAHTEGYVGGAWVFDTKWNDETGAWDYRLPETTLEALRLESLV